MESMSRRMPLLRGAWARFETDPGQDTILLQSFYGAFTLGWARPRRLVGESEALMGTQRTLRIALWACALISTAGSARGDTKLGASPPAPVSLSLALGKPVMPAD